MSKWKVLALAALALVVGVQEASAVKIASKPVGYWFSSGATSPTPVTRVDRRDLHQVPDTTFIFNLEGCSLPTLAQTATASKDSVTIAYLRFYSDSSVAVTNTLSTINYTWQGSGDGVTWYTIVSQANNAIITSGDCGFALPIWINVGQGWGTTGTKISTFLHAKYMRLLITGGTGNFFAARCELLYFSD